jgi:hypothetical protein
MSVWLMLLAAGLGLALLVVYTLWRQQVRAAFIRETLLPPGLLDTLVEPFPHLGLKERQLVARGLRKFFLAQLKAGRQPVAMPSRVVGALWSAFARRRAAYDAYCRQALGRTLPPSAPVALSAEREANAALRRCWWHCCREENLDPATPTRVPLLFALDAKLRIANGHFYFVDQAARLQRLRKDHGGDGGGGDFTFEHERSWTSDDLRDTSWDGGTDGFGDSGGGDGGGDGGGGD